MWNDTPARTARLLLTGCLVVGAEFAMFHGKPHSDDGDNGDAIQQPYDSLQQRWDFARFNTRQTVEHLSLPTRSHKELVAQTDNPEVGLRTQPKLPDFITFAQTEEATPDLSTTPDDARNFPSAGETKQPASKTLPGTPVVFELLDEDLADALLEPIDVASMLPEGIQLSWEDTMRSDDLEVVVAPREDASRQSVKTDLREVDVAQLTPVSDRSAYIEQLAEPLDQSTVRSTLAAQVDAMQVALPPPPQFTAAEQALLLAEAPTEMTVRLGDEAVGKVNFRVSETRAIEVQLSGLIDLVADHLAPEEYSRLRSSTAAEGFVSLDRIRAIGLFVHYNPAYDELEFSA